MTTSDGFSGVPIFILVVGGFVAVMFPLILGFIIVTAVRSRRVLRQAGLDPMAAQAQLAVRLANGPLGRTLEQRLRELDDLRARGVISEQEHAEARAKALGS